MTNSILQSWYGYTAIVIFILAYILVIAEEYIHLRKSKPVIIAAGLIWILVAIVYKQAGQQDLITELVEKNLLEYANLLLFLLSAMTFVNTMEDRNIFAALRTWLVGLGLSLRSVFWITGLFAFFISPIADNLTTALVMSSVVIAVARDNKNFVLLGCINIVVAANAGGAFSPFGDITTLMVWQAKQVQFGEFIELFIPATVNWLVPAFIMSFAIEKTPTEPSKNPEPIQPGGLITVALFIFTISMAVIFEHLLSLPPTLGMMTGLGLLQVHGYFLRRQNLAESEFQSEPFDIYKQLQRAEWDTLMFFYGVIMSVGGLGALGYLAVASHVLYDGLGTTNANILIGLLSAVIDNIPIMFAVITMSPDMSVTQWLLVTLTAGVGGSILSIGSAAGVALMGQARGIYTFFGHLKWSWAIGLGYFSSIGVHLMMH